MELGVLRKACVNDFMWKLYFLLLTFIVENLGLLEHGLKRLVNFGLE